MMKAARVLTLLVVLALCACTSQSPTPAGTAAAAPVTAVSATSPAAVVQPPAAGKAAITGQVENTAQLWQESPLYIYAAPYSGSKNSPGFFLLDPHQHPSAELQAGGAFQLNNVPPGNYVLVVGPDPEQARAVVDAQQQTRIFQVTAGQVLDAGRLILAP